MNMALPIMAHLVLGYPTLEKSLRTAETYVRAGCRILELQIPFSHPTADGPVITRACQVAVGEQGITVTNCLDAIRRLRQQFPQQEMMVMSYLNPVFAYGPEAFVEVMNDLHIRHLIIPDLPVDAAFPHFPPGRLVPVLAANVPDARLDGLLRSDFDFYYLMSDFKITGSTFSLHPRLRDIAARIRQARPAARIGIGFGIESPAQIEAVLDVADVAIIGSALIRAAEQGVLQNYFENIGRGATLVS